MPYEAEKSGDVKKVTEKLKKTYEAQLAKYNLTAQRVDGYDGASMASAELQHLLNTCVVSVEHDALVMDGSRSVLVSEFFFLRKKLFLGNLFEGLCWIARPSKRRLTTKQQQHFSKKFHSVYPRLQQ